MPAEALEIRYTGVLDYPPLKHGPSDFVVDEAGRLWFALPTLRAVALYVPDVGVNLVEIGFAASDLSYGHGIVIAYSQGSLEAVFLDAGSGRILRKITEAGYLDIVVPVAEGFVFVERDSITGEPLLAQFSASGEARWRWRIEGKGLPPYRAAAGSGRSVWLSTRDGELLLVEVGRESYRSFRIDGRAVALASRDGKAWAVRGDGVVLRVSAGGVEARIETGLTFRVGDEAFALPGDRLVILSRIDGIMVEIDAGKESRASLQYPFTDAALRGVSEIYLLDPGEKRILVASVSRPPVILDYRAESPGEGVIRVYARVYDPDGDLAEGYPLAVLSLGGQSSSSKMTYSGGVYSAELEVPGGEGVLRVYVRAKDLGGNEESVEVASFSVSGGRVISEASRETTREKQAPPPSPLDTTGLFPLAVEMALLVVLLSSLTVILLGRSRRQRRRRR